MIPTTVLVFLIPAIASAIIPLPSAPSPIPEPPTVDASPSLLPDEKTSTSLEVTSSAHHLPRVGPKVSRNRMRLHSHNSRVSRTREIEVMSEKCNDQGLQEIMATAMVPSLSISKMVISERATRDFGSPFDVICARGHFSYYVEASTYCEVTVRDMTCLAYKSSSNVSSSNETSVDISEKLIKNIEKSLVKNINSSKAVEKEPKKHN